MKKTEDQQLTLGVKVSGISQFKYRFLRKFRRIHYTIFSSFVRIPLLWIYVFIQLLFSALLLRIYSGKFLDRDIDLYLFKGFFNSNLQNLAFMNINFVRLFITNYVLLNVFLVTLLLLIYKRLRVELAETLILCMIMVNILIAKTLIGNAIEWSLI